MPLRPSLAGDPPATESAIESKFLYKTVNPLTGVIAHSNPNGDLPADRIYAKDYTDFYNLYLKAAPDRISFWTEDPAEGALNRGPNQPKTWLDSEGNYQTSLNPKEYHAHVQELMREGVLPQVPWRTAAPIKGVTYTIIDLGDTGMKARVWHPSASRSARGADQRSAAERPGPIVVSVHGGGWVDGNWTGGGHINSRIAEALGLPVVSVQYPLAPTNKYPTAHECLSKEVEWIRTTLADQLGRSGKGLIFFGQSAGANLIASTVGDMLNHPEAEVRQDVIGTALTVPVTDVTAANIFGPAFRRLGDTTINSDVMNLFVECTATRPEDREDPRWSVLFATPETLAKHRNLAIVTAEHDALSIEGKAYYQKVVDAVKAAGGDTSGLSWTHFDGMSHLAQGLDAICQESRRKLVGLIRTMAGWTGMSEEEIQEITEEDLYPDPLWQPSTTSE